MSNDKNKQKAHRAQKQNDKRKVVILKKNDNSGEDAEEEMRMRTLCTMLGSREAITIIHNCQNSDVYRCNTPNVSSCSSSSGEEQEQKNKSPEKVVILDESEGSKQEETEDEADRRKEPEREKRTEIVGETPQEAESTELPQSIQANPAEGKGDVVEIVLLDGTHLFVNECCIKRFNNNDNDIPEELTQLNEKEGHEKETRPSRSTLKEAEQPELEIITHDPIEPHENKVVHSTPREDLISHGPGIKSVETFEDVRSGKVRTATPTPQLSRKTSTLQQKSIFDDIEDNVDQDAVETNPTPTPVVAIPQTSQPITDKDKEVPAKGMKLVLMGQDGTEQRSFMVKQHLCSCNPEKPLVVNSKLNIEWKNLSTKDNVGCCECADKDPVKGTKDEEAMPVVVLQGTNEIGPTVTPVSEEKVSLEEIPEVRRGAEGEVEPEVVRAAEPEATISDDDLLLYLNECCLKNSGSLDKDALRKELAKALKGAGGKPIVEEKTNVQPRPIEERSDVESEPENVARPPEERTNIETEPQKLGTKTESKAKVAPCVCCPGKQTKRKAQLSNKKNNCCCIKRQKS